MIKLNVSVILLVLAGCSLKNQHDTEPEIQIPILEKCLFERPHKPVWRSEGVENNVASFDRLLFALHDLHIARAYIIRLEAVLSACE